jgi:POT family proton-dependent oligopeptide transporter
MAAGHLMLATNGLFFPALSCLIVGCGCLKGNISTQVGLLYATGDDEGRRRGYLLFTVGVNVGAFIGPLVCGALGETLGWSWGFGAAAAGMLLGLGVYIKGARYVPADAPRRDTSGYALSRDDRGVVVALLGVLIIATFYNIAYGQSLNVGPLWLREMTNRSLAGFQMPVSWYLASDGFFTIAFTPVAISLLAWLGRRQWSPSALISIAFGCACAVVADGLLAGLSAAPAKSLSCLWGFLYFAICDWGYLFVWPVVLALVAQVSPASLKSTLMGVAFLSLFVANLTAGWLGRFYAAISHGQFWLMHGAIALTGVVIATAASFIVQPMLDARSASRQPVP